MDFTKLTQQPQGGSTCDAAPGGAVGGPTQPSVGPLGSGFEAYRLGPDDKWKRMPIEKMRDMEVRHAVIGPWVLKQGDTYYCANDATYNKLSDKGDNRKWMHDLLINAAPTFKDGWLMQTVGDILNI